MVVECVDTTIKFSHEKVHLYTWRDENAPPQQVVLLIHGLMMHGKAFDQIASRLAAGNSLVVAPDLRGFGRFYYGSEGDKRKIDYTQSLDDISLLLQELSSEHPNLPLFCAGESLGAHLARQVVASHPDLVSGMILSSPCVRPRMLSLPLIPYTCSELMLAGLDPNRELNLSPFARQFLKNEESNLQHYLDDPMTRKSLEILELIDSMRVVGLMESAIVPAEIPILVLRGKNDCVCKISSAKKFLESLEAKNMTIHQCDESGHLILQAKTLNESILAVIENWLAKTLTTIV